MLRHERMNEKIWLFFYFIYFFKLYYHFLYNYNFFVDFSHLKNNNISFFLQ